MLVSVFGWRLLGMFSFLFLAFTISITAVTLILINEIHQNNIDPRKVTFVEVANWIYVGFMGLTLISILFAAPYFRKFTMTQKTVNPTTMTGLKPASRNDFKRNIKDVRIG